MQPPSLESLRQRLEKRSTDSAKAIEKRVAKAKEELAYAQQFDVILVNDQLEKAVAEIKTIVRNFLSGKNE